jgi:hypothetical protein
MITKCVVHKVILLNHASVGLPVAAAFANFVFIAKFEWSVCKFPNNEAAGEVAGARRDEAFRFP